MKIYYQVSFHIKFSKISFQMIFFFILRISTAKNNNLDAHLEKFNKKFFEDIVVIPKLLEKLKYIKFKHTSRKLFWKAKYKSLIVKLIYKNPLAIFYSKKLNKFKNNNLQLVQSDISEINEFLTTQFLISSPHSSKLATLVEVGPKAPFSIATTPRCRGGQYTFPCIALLYPWSITYKCWRLSKEISRTIFWVFGMTQPGIEPRSHRPLANPQCIILKKIFFKN